MGHCPEWIDKILFEKSLRTYLKDDRIALNSFNIKAALAAGENFTSDMYRASVDYTTGDGVREKMMLIVKLVPDQGLKTDFANDMLIFEKEMRMYRDMLPELNKKLGDIRALSAQCLFAETKTHSVIILEDLSLLGFGMANRQIGLDMKHSLMAMEYLAKLHAASALLYKEKPETMDFYDFGLFNDQHGKAFVETFISKGFKGLIMAAEQWPGFEKYVEKLKKIQPKFVKHGIALTKKDPNGFNVLCHGDTWINNMLFKYAEDKVTPVKMKFVDFQMSIFTSPVIDLHYFIFTSPAEEVRINHMEKLLQHYHSSLVKTIVQLGSSPDELRVPTYDQLVAEFHKRGFYGVVASAVIMPIIRAPPRDDASLDGIFSDDVDQGFVDFMYNNSAYRATMSNLLPYFDKKGYLDI
ncbi:uncharacterized protein LOC123302223 isoform X2 [Chrysoperla carnea]|uniref:uncharacterized protein LOC123302223 isoform X2 n=1 Tax=Chrysoperla carnea TaxID=189513 RepID=UPI001D07F320|nr:uncharacterized protein LOC123302223 isoform X2 [Chrysoperla carnea]